MYWVDIYYLGVFDGIDKVQLLFVYGMMFFGIGGFFVVVIVCGLVKYSLIFECDF